MNIPTAILSQVSANIRQGYGQPTDLFLGFETDKEVCEHIAGQVGLLTNRAPAQDAVKVGTLEGATMWGMTVHVLKNRPICAFVGRVTAADIP